MTTLREMVDRYLALRRGLGYKLKIEGRMLGQFVGFCDARGLEHVTVTAALAWATAPAGADVSWWAARLTVIRESSPGSSRRSTTAPRFHRRICCRAEMTALSPICIHPRRSPRW